MKSRKSSQSSSVEGKIEMGRFNYDMPTPFSHLTNMKRICLDIS